MTKIDVLRIVNVYYAYHRSNNKGIKAFKLSNEVETAGGTVRAYGVYFNFDKKAYEYKGKYIYVCALTIKNPYITDDQTFSALIKLETKRALYKKGFDSVVLVRKNQVVEVVCFTNSQIEIESVL